MKQIEGIFYPATDKHGWFTKLPVINGTPSYHHDRLAAAYAACSKFDVAVDVGAHIGLVSRQLADQFGHVWAFEPIPENYECLVANTQGRGVDLFNMALGNRRGQVTLNCRGKKSVSWTSSLVPDDGTDRARQCVVSCMPLDAWEFDKYGVDFIKIDVEGWEHEVIKGAAATIRRWHPVLMIEEKFDKNFLATKHLQKLGYRMVWHDKNDRIFKWSGR
jgi:FkbM family methyltransferase